MSEAGVVGVGLVVGDVEPAVETLRVLGASKLDRHESAGAVTLSGRLGPLALTVLKPVAGSADGAWLDRRGPGIRRLFATGDHLPSAADADRVLGYTIEPASLQAAGSKKNGQTAGLASALYQIGTAAPDAAAAADMLHAAGADEFQIKELSSELTFRGKRVVNRRVVAIANFGAVDLEVIEPVEGDGAHTEFVRKHGPGANHFSVLKTADEAPYRNAFEQLEGAGFKGFYSVKTENYEAEYFDLTKSLGIFIELVWMFGESPFGR